MEEAVGGSNKVTSIREIVRLKALLKKWEKVTIGAKAKNNKNQQSPSSSTGKQIGGIPPGVLERLKSSEIRCDSDDESECRSPEPPHDVPKGYLAVYVGPELRRFIIPTSYLSDKLFKVLLEKVEEEFGFDQSGALTIPCEIETFKYLLQCMENHQRENNLDIIQVPEDNHIMS